MRNGDKIREAMQRAYPDALINVYNDSSAEEVKIYFNGQMIARFKSVFWDEDFDNPEIEIKVKAPLKSIKDFLEECEGCWGVADVMQAVERGLKEWEEGLQQNS